jgi:hypothetical protein
MWASSMNPRCWTNASLRTCARFSRRWSCSATRRSWPRWVQSGEMVFDKLSEGRKLVLHRIHRQTEDNPILDLAHALADERLGFEAFERWSDGARRDDRVVWAERVEADADGAARCWSGAMRRGCG